MASHPALLPLLILFSYCSFFTSAAPNSPLAYLPAAPTNLTTIYSPGGVSIQYKSPFICETTPGVRSYRGYVGLDADTHIFFWFFEAKQSPSTAPTALWLTGGPGNDSLLATFLGKWIRILIEVKP
jgi:hypothetical protein